MHHRHLERLFERSAQGRGRITVLLGGVAQQHDHAVQAVRSLQRRQDGRATGEAAVDEQLAIHVHRRKGAGHGRGRHEGVDRKGLVVEETLLAAGQIGGGHDHAYV